MGRVVEFGAAEGVLAGELQVAVAVLGAKHGVAHVDIGRGDGAHLRDAIRVTRQNAGGAGGADHLIGERPRLVAVQVGLVGEIVDRVERELRRRRKLEIELHADTGVVARVVDILRAVVPDKRGLVGRVLKIARGAEKAVGILAVEEIHRDTEIPLPAEHVEDFLIREIQQRIDPVRLAERHVLGERRREPGGEIVGHAALLLHTERGAALEVDRAAEGVGAFVRRVALHDLEALEHSRREVLHIEPPGHRAGKRDQAAVDGDAVEVVRHAADRDAGDVALVVEFAGGARQAHGEFAGAHVGQIAEGIHRDDVLHVGGVALRRERRRIALALAGDFEFGELVNGRREIEIAHRALTGGDRHFGARGIESEVGSDDGVIAGRQIGQREASGVVRQHGATEVRQLHAGTGEMIAGGRIADRARKGCAI